MVELLREPITGEWVSIAPLRGQRPHVLEQGAYADERVCPFCLENKDIVETYACGDVRVVPNLFPILNGQMPQGYGFHEVLIDTPKHTASLHQLSLEEIWNVLAAVRHRVSFFYQDTKIQYVQVFKNQGARAGASIFHTHWQIVAMPFLPQKKAIMQRNFKQYHAQNGNCYICTLHDLAGELEVLRKGRAFAYVPAASLYSGGVDISVSGHVGNWHEMEDALLGDVAFVLRKVLSAMQALLGGVDYNIICHGSPCAGDGFWHFYLQIVPRIENFAGYEISTNSYINASEPCATALALRQKILELCV